MAARKAAAPALPATWDQVLAHRVTAHHLDTPATGGLVPLVRRLCGVHAQLASSAEAAVWLRGGFGADTLRRAGRSRRTGRWSGPGPSAARCTCCRHAIWASARRTAAA